MRTLAIEVLPYHKAPWAPRVGGCTFPWAYRVLRSGEQVIAAACDGSRRYAERQARQAAERVRCVSQGIGNARVYVINGATLCHTHR